MRTTISVCATTLVAGLSLAACQKPDSQAAAGDTTGGAMPATAGDSGGMNSGATGATTAGDTTRTMKATVRNALGRELGTLTLADAAQGIRVTGRLAGLPPGEHAIHVHTVGKCDPPFTSAGAHWNPLNHEHGAENPKGPHLGDMHNFTVAADSSVTIDAMTTG